MIYDIHCHLEGLSSGLMEDLPKKNLSIILNGLDYGSNEKILQLSKNNPLIHCAMGMHPTNDFDEKIINQIKNNSKSIRAISKLGLTLSKASANPKLTISKK
jgi:Tat protein secretion system quality control protein TatD with DNase activity